MLAVYWLQFREIFFSFVGDAICDGGTIRWQYFSPIHDLSEEDLSTMSTSDMQAHSEKMMEKNAWAVAAEVKLRIEDSPAPSGFTKALVVEQPGMTYNLNEEPKLLLP